MRPPIRRPEGERVNRREQGGRRGATRHIRSTGKLKHPPTPLSGDPVSFLIQFCVPRMARREPVPAYGRAVRRERFGQQAQVPVGSPGMGDDVRRPDVTLDVLFRIDAFLFGDGCPKV